MKDHFRPVGKPAPPRPRRPEFLTSSMIQSRPLAISAPVPSHCPRRRAAGRRQSCSPYRLVKMRSLSVNAMTYSPGTSVNVSGPPSGALVWRPMTEPGAGRSPRLSASSSLTVLS